MLNYLYNNVNRRIELNEALSYSNNIFNTIIPCMLDKDRMTLSCVKISFEYFYAGKQCMYVLIVLFFYIIISLITNTSFFFFNSI